MRSYEAAPLRRHEMVGPERSRRRADRPAAAQHGASLFFIKRAEGTVADSPHLQVIDANRVAMWKGAVFSFYWTT